MSSLCQLAAEWKGDMPLHGALVECKIDGFRCMYFPDHLGKPTLWTRGGIPYRGTDHILRHCIRMEQAAGEPMMFDGEFQVDGTLAATKAHQERGWREGDAGLFHVFDALPLARWRADDCAEPLYRRKAMLAELVTAAAPDPDAWEWEEGSRGRAHGEPPVRLLPDRWCADADELEAFAAEIWAAGGEGVMLKDAEAPYRRKRSNVWMKLKSAAQLRLAA